jgi:hypothetical protein
MELEVHRFIVEQNNYKINAEVKEEIAKIKD